MARYDEIGRGYAAYRREDPDIARRIHDALGNARTVVNVGAGTGSYEPADRTVIPIEPSAVMASQRPPDRAVAIRGTADALPLFDGSVDAAMAVLTLHHWKPRAEEGVRQMRGVATGPVVIVTIDAVVSARNWLMADYLHEVAALDLEIFPPPEQIRGWLSPDATIEIVPIARTSPDWSLLSFWAHPERVLDEGARNATSGFARMPNEVVERVVRDVRRDLDDGTWDARHGHLRELDSYDAGLRLIVDRQHNLHT